MRWVLALSLRGGIALKSSPLVLYLASICLLPSRYSCYFYLCLCYLFLCVLCLAIGCLLVNCVCRSFFLFFFLLFIFHTLGTKCEISLGVGK